MPLSNSILEFLEWLEENGQHFDKEFLVEMVGGPDGCFIREQHEEEPELHAEYVKFRKILRTAASQVTQSKWQPTDIAQDPARLLDAVSKLGIDDPLDEYVTTLALRGVTEAVARLKKLSAMHLGTHPSENVTNYFRQAVSAYVCGLYDAVAVLSRSALEFALREILIKRGMLPLQSNGHGKGSIEDLINWAGKARLLKTDSVQSAHVVRRTGNKVHSKRIIEREALNVVSLTLQLFNEIYGQPSMTAKKA